MGLWETIRAKAIDKHRKVDPDSYFCVLQVMSFREVCGAIDALRARNEELAREIRELKAERAGPLGELLKRPRGGGEERQGPALAVRGFDLMGERR